MYCEECDKHCELNEVTTGECPKCKSRMVFHCQLCDGSIKTFDNTLRHTKYTCRSIMSYSCNDCDYQHRHKCYLQYHIEQKHGEPSSAIVKCPKCQQDFKGKYNMTRHEKTCGRAPHLICKFCPYKIKYPNHLKIHVKKHHMDRIKTIAEYNVVCKEILKKGKELLGMKIVQNCLRFLVFVIVKDYVIINNLFCSQRSE